MTNHNSERLCDWCHAEPVDGRYLEVIGIDTKRTQGGTNKLTNRKETGRMPCYTCFTRLRDGVHINQQTLL